MSSQKMSKSICLRLALAGLFLIPQAVSQEPSQQSSPSPITPYVEREEREFNFFPGGKVEILMDVPGSLKILGWNKSAVKMEAEKIVYYETGEKAKDIMKRSPIRIRRGQTTAAIRASGTAVPPAILEINLTVYLPSEKTDVHAVMNRGEFAIHSINGWVEVTLQEGSLEAGSMAGYFSGIVQRGDIHVEMSGKHWNGLEFAALTRQGSINLVLPLEYSAALQLETRDGKITIDYPPRIEDGEEIPPEIIIKKKSQSLKASVGDGGAPIRLVTYSGNIALSKKED